MLDECEWCGEDINICDDCGGCTECGDCYCDREDWYEDATVEGDPPTAKAFPPIDPEKLPF
jgi:hypothetical protein